MANKPVFFDVTGRRAARLSTLGWVAAIVSTVLGIGFVASLVVAQPDVTVDLPGRSIAVNPPQLIARAVAPGLLKSAARLAAEARARRLEIQRLRHFRNIMPARVPTVLKPQ
jgi:peptidoglycan-N-acetylglucosamine deacetylase